MPEVSRQRKNPSFLVRVEKSNRTCFCGLAVRRSTFFFVLQAPFLRWRPGVGCCLHDDSPHGPGRLLLAFLFCRPPPRNKGKMRKKARQQQTVYAATLYRDSGHLLLHSRRVAIRLCTLWWPSCQGIQGSDRQARPNKKNGLPTGPHPESRPFFFLFFLPLSLSLFSF